MAEDWEYQPKSECEDVVGRWYLVHPDSSNYQASILRIDKQWWVVDDQQGQIRLSEILAEPEKFPRYGPYNPLKAAKAAYRMLIATGVII